MEARLSFLARDGSALARCRAIEVIRQDWSIEVVALFLEDSEPGRVALSCHMAMDLVCEEMGDACWNGSEFLGSPCSL